MTASKPPAARLDVKGGSRLAQLMAERDQLAPAVKAGTERLKELTDAIKVELTRARPDADTIVAAGEGVTALRLYAKRSVGLDTKRLKAEAPETYVRYAVERTAWTLSEVKS